MSEKIMSVILTAKESKEMKSVHPTAMIPVCGKCMAEYVLDAACGAGSKTNVMIVGYGEEEVRAHFSDRVLFETQTNPVGTADAVRHALKHIENFDGICLVLPADAPLIEADTLAEAIEFHKDLENAATIITAVVDNPDGYGRIIRNNAGDVVGIVEQKNADAYELEIGEVNSSMYIFNAADLVYALSHMDALCNGEDTNNLIHTLDVLIKSGRKVGAFDTEDSNSVLGVNDRIQLFEVEAIMRWRINFEHMLNGVTILAPEATYIEPDVEIGTDTVIYPNCHLKGNTKIGKHVCVGANSMITNSIICDGVDILNSVIVDSYIDSGTHVGPFAYLRPNSKVGQNVKIGDFVEIKNATIDDGTKISHLTYVGDSDVGKRVNFGCGCVTVNYDGKKKYRTVINDDAFIGCNTNLVSPVTVQEGAYIAAGSTITEDVPEKTLAIARARQVNKTNWKDRRSK